MLVRAATSADASDILDWRNDPSSRAMFVNQADVAPADHHAWLQARLADPFCTLLIGMHDGNKLGICRFDRSPSQDTAEVSINLNPMMRGKRLASTFLRAALADYRRTRPAQIHAIVKTVNHASLRCFDTCGFKPLCRGANYVHLVLEMP